MDYETRFKELLKTTAKGFGIGLVISIVLVLLMGIRVPGDFIGLTSIFTILFGSGISLVICSKTGAQGFMSGAVSRLWVGIKALFFGSIWGGSGILILFGIIKLFIGVIIMVPVGLYMAVSYFLNLIYLGIMCLLEKKEKLTDKDDLCAVLDKIVPVISLVVVAVLCVSIIKLMN